MLKHRRLTVAEAQEGLRIFHTVPLRLLKVDLASASNYWRCEMQVFTYSEVRQKLASVLDKAETTGRVIIRRRDGRSFALIPQETQASP